MVMPGAKREVAAHLCEVHGVSQRRACTTLAVDRSTVRYASRRDNDAALRARIRDIAAERQRFGYPLAGRRLLANAVRRRIHALLQRDGVHVNHKKLRRL